ncbi:hypothetical protein ASAC_1070 [Acidilobus saccharovorans 345-15]|uniref:Uncharacterized protein n=1 Tax=Acidilobus saccharovorans (strain DSM 16705 / JCM 18335 / VKM B-2471 / 345-15) TaxID=666510 RepID=D9Q2D7_ACIS3|nr:hypothetical protein [Acidilobus saccharovorans]ADL19475.1 hypothetical protein ASAC_1070 [Acidilobus saccharovorans 345-15]
MKRVLRGDPFEGDDLEPTPGASSLCLEELFTSLSRDDVYELFSQLVSSEVNYVDVLVHSDDNREIYARCFVSLTCLEVLKVVVRLCENEARLDAINLPEVDAASLEGDCVELISRPDPPIKIRNLLRKLGVGEPSEVQGYRLLKDDQVGDPTEV